MSRRDHLKRFAQYTAKDAALTAANSYVRPDNGGRRCRKCRDAYMKQYQRSRS